MKWLQRLLKVNEPPKNVDHITYEDIKDLGTVYMGGRTWVRVDALTEHIIPDMLRQVNEDSTITPQQVVVGMHSVLTSLDAGTFDIVFAKQIENEE